MQRDRPPLFVPGERARLGDVLVASGDAKRTQIEHAAQQALLAHRRLGEELVREGLLREEDVWRALAIQHGVEPGGVDELLAIADPAVVASVSRAFVERNHLMPIAQIGGRVVVATDDPDASVGDLAKAFASHPLDVRLLTPTDYHRLTRAIELGAGKETSAVSAPSHAAEDLLARPKLGQEYRYVSLFDALLLDAIGEGASDIHLEQYGERVRVRLRVDGDLLDVRRFELSAEELRGVINVLKVASNLDIAERRLPQGGRFRRRAGEHVFDLRVQTQPSLYAEHAIVRLLPQDARVLGIEELGLPPPIASEYRRLLDSPSGLVLVVGPTGSGKSTTLYAGLQLLARDATRKVITAEDPIEYSIDGVQQTQVKPEIGFVFANAMRAFVREDPDVILVGEIRDDETALEAIRASQTGHVVLSTLHCNDAVDAVQRLLDLGMHPSSIASELLAVLAQRLAKRVCDGCRAPAEPEPSIMAELFPRGAPEGFRAFAGRGCERCHGRGTRGRIAVVEYLRSGPAVRRGIAHRMAVDDLREVASVEGLVPMRESALDLVQRGIIPLAELPMILTVERMSEGAEGSSA